MAKGKDEPKTTEEEHASRIRKMFERCVDSERDWKSRATRNIDYVYGDQYTVEEVKEREAAGLQTLIVNEIAPIVDTILGESDLLTHEWTVSPFENLDEATARGYEIMLRNIRERSGLEDVNDETAESAVHTGRGVTELYADQKDGDEALTLYYRHVPYDECWIDPYCRSRNIAKDADHFFRAKWMYKDEAIRIFPDHKDEIKNLIESTEDMQSTGETEDVPLDLMYADYQKQRVRIVEGWYRKMVDGESQIWTMFFSGDGKHDELVFSDKRAVWAKRYHGKGVNRIEFKEEEYEEKDFMTMLPFAMQIVKWRKKSTGSSWYGVVDIMLSSQDEINHRHNKALAALDTSGVIYEEGAIDHEKEEAVKSEISRPDYWIKVNPNKRFEVDKNTDIGRQQYEMMIAAENRIKRVSNSPDEFRGIETNAQSGKAILARENAGRKGQGNVYGNAARYAVQLGKLTIEYLSHIVTEDMVIQITNDPIVADQMVNIPMSSLKRDIVVNRKRPSADVRQKELEMLAGLQNEFGVRIPPELLIVNTDLENKEAMIRSVKQQQEAASQPTPEQQAEAMKAQAKVQLDQANAKKALESANKLHMEAMQINAELRDYMAMQREQGAKIAALERAVKDPRTNVVVS